MARTPDSIRLSIPAQPAAETSPSLRKWALQDRPPVGAPIPIASLLELETPHAVVDSARLSANISRVAQYCRAHNLGLMPQVKTHKCPEIARQQLDAGARGLTVITAREAEVMADVAPELLISYPPVDPGRIERIVRLSERLKLSVALDSRESLRRLQAAMAAHFANRADDTGLVDVLVEIDLGARRTGISDTKELIKLAELAQIGTGTRFAGLMIHPGHVENLRAEQPYRDAVLPREDGLVAEQVRAMSEQIRTYISALTEVGMSCGVVSGGNTPLLFYSHLVPELTEIRPGTYVYCDRDTATQGIFGWLDCAYSILATVVSTQVKGQCVVDAGTKALAKEPLEGVRGYGALLDRPEVVVSRMSEEHGILDLSQTDWQPQVGDRVRIVPNHVCVSLHLQDRFAIADSGTLTVRPVAARGR
jgi:D-serine deaminase-like pyridoxal phosphate-dependent protein